MIILCNKDIFLCFHSGCFSVFLFLFVCFSINIMLQIWGEAFNLSLLNVSSRFFVCLFVCLWCCWCLLYAKGSFIPIYWEFLSESILNCFKCFFCIHWNNCIIFLFILVNCIYSSKYWTNSTFLRWTLFGHNAFAFFLCS